MYRCPFTQYRGEIFFVQSAGREAVEAALVQPYRLDFTEFTGAQTAEWSDLQA